MIDPELLETLKAASVNDRIALIEAILKSLKQDINSASQQSIAETRPLRGKLSHYDDPYAPVDTEDCSRTAFCL